MAIGDFFTKTMDGGDPVVATVSTNRSGGGTSLSCDDLDNWPNDTVHYITYKKKASGAIDYDTLQTFKGIVSGNTIGTVTFKSSPTGSDLGNDIGDYVRLAPTASYAQDLYDGLAVSHDVDGTLKAGAVDTAAVLANEVVETAKIDDLAVTTPKIADGAVTPDKLSTGAELATVSTPQATSSVSFTDLSTPGPAVTVTIGANGLALVSFGAQISNSTGDARNSIGVFMTGANTDSPSVGSYRTLVHAFTGTATSTTGDRTILFTGLTPGSTTFTLKYACTPGTATYFNRYISVVPL